jgi:Lsr2
MATRIVSDLRDDLDGSKAKETVRFSLDGVEYEIDLSERNANRLRNSLSDFIAHGRKIGGRKRRSNGRGTDKAQLARIRSWAKSHGMKVSDRGRISQEVQDAYQASH